MSRAFLCDVCGDMHATASDLIGLEKLDLDLNPIYWQAVTPAEKADAHICHDCQKRYVKTPSDIEGTIIYVNKFVRCFGSNWCYEYWGTPVSWDQKKCEQKAKEECRENYTHAGAFRFIQLRE